MQRALLPPFLTLLLAPGCGPGTPATPGSESTTDASTSTSTATPTSSSSAASSSTSTSSTSGDDTSATSSASTSSEPASTFIQRPDLIFVDSCDAFTQDCPPGEKCMPYADDGGGSWNNTKCVPIMEDPAGIGEPCFVVDSGVSGLDNCELGAMCWYVDEQNHGECIPLCVGSPDSATCPQGFSCTYSRSASFGLCIRDCDPLAQDCHPSDVCIANPNGTGFLCVLDGSGREGQTHDPCMYANACDPGLWCVPTTAAKECDPDATGCCEPYCDITAPNNCPGEDQECITIYEGEPAPDYPNLGYCSLPI